MGKKKNNFLIRTSLAFITGVCTVFFSSPVLTVDADSKTVNGVVSNNIHENDYSGTGSVDICSLVNNNNGTFSRVEFMQDIILVETYNTKCQLLSQRFVKPELQIYGGCFNGGNCNYILYGNENLSNDPKKETVRVVKYSKDWQRLGAASLYGCNTQMPFENCNVDLSEYGDNVFVRMGHRTYDGNHAVMSFSFSASSFEVRDIISSDKDTEKGCYSDSAATYIDTSDGYVVAADHSLIDPYACVVSRYDKQAGEEKFVSHVSRAYALRMENGEAKLGGFESSPQYYLAVGCGSPQDGTSPNMNVFVSSVPKNGFGSNVELAYLTGYAYGDGNTVMMPYLLKVDNDNFAVIWECRDGYGETATVNYTYIDGAGNMKGEVQAMDGCLSDCRPLLVGNTIYWYTTDGSSLKIYSIPAYASAKQKSPSVKAAQEYKGVDYSRVFDYSYYVSRYPDMRVLFEKQPEKALEHFVSVGMAEGRQGCENFNPAAYKANYADIRKAYGNNWTQYYLHFMKIGYAEGRNARNYND